MELAPDKSKESLNFPHETVSIEVNREIAIMALISVVKDRDEYSSGHEFPNIPFGD